MNETGGCYTEKDEGDFCCFGSETFFSPLGKVLDCPLIGGITILCSWFSVTGKSTFLIYNSVHDGYADWLTFIEIGFLYVYVYTYKYFLPYENCSS